MAKKLSFKYGAEHERGRLYYVQDTSIKIPLIEGQVLFAYKQFDTNKSYPYKAFINDLVLPQGDIRIYMDTDANARVPISAYFSDYSSQLWDLTNAEAVMEGDTDEPVYFNNGVPVQCSGVVVTSEAQTFNGNKTFTGTISTPKIEMPSTGGSGKTSIYFVNSANARTLYIRDYNTTAAYIATTSGTSSVGSGTKPVYVNGSGVIKASSSTKGSTSLPMYLNSGTFSACVPQDMFSAMSWTDGTDNGPTLSLTMFGHTRSDIIPAATSSVSGIVTTGTQEFSGDKTFKNFINIDTNSSTAFTGTNNIYKYFAVGNLQSKFIAIDPNDIQAINKDTTSDLYLNPDGGYVYLGAGGVKISEDGDLHVPNDFVVDGQVSITNTTASSSYQKGALVVAGGIGVGAPSYLDSLYTKGIYPRVTGSYPLGSSSYIWSYIYGGSFKIYDATNKYDGGSLACTSSKSTTSQPTYLTLGNATATGTAGSRYGELRLYSKGTKYSKIITEDNSSSDRTITIPALDGNMVLSNTVDISTPSVTYPIAFFTNNYKQIGQSNGFSIHTYTPPDTGGTDRGVAQLYLGNSSAAGVDGNKFGKLTLYSTNSNAINLLAADELADSQTVYLRKYWSSNETNAYLIATLDTTAVGDTDEPVYINSNGVATKCSGVVVTTGAQTFSGDKSFSKILFTAGGYSHGSISTSTSTSTTSKSATLALGNSTATGTAGSRYGTVQLYNNKGKYTYLRFSNDGTTNGIINYLPPVAGTLMNGNYMVGVSGTTYGSTTQMNALSSPKTGQMFFVLI